MDDATLLMAPNEVTLPKMLPMERSEYKRLRIFLSNLMGRVHPANQGPTSFGKALYDQEVELEEYTPKEKRLKPHISALMTQWVHTHFL